MPAKLTLNVRLGRRSSAGTQLLNKPYGRSQLARKLRSVIENQAV